MSDPLGLPFMVHALEAGTAVAIMAGAVGWFMVLRRESFAGHTLSLMAFPGATGALWLGLPPTAGQFAFCGATALLLGSGRPAGQRSGWVAARTGTVQACGLACGLLFLSLYGGVLGGYESVLFGDFLGISSGQVVTLAIVAALALVALSLVGRPLLFASIDNEVAGATGVPVRWLSALFLLLLGASVAATARITGVLLVFALLVAPAATAQALTGRIVLGLTVSVVVALLLTWAGLLLALAFPLPVGFWITTLALAAYVVTLLGRAAVRRREARA